MKIQEAEKKELELKELKLKYDDLIKEYSQQKKEKTAELQQQINIEKIRLEKQLEEELKTKRDNFFSGLEIEKQELIDNLKETMINTAAGFADKILSFVVDDSLEVKLANQALNIIDKLSENEIKEIINPFKDSSLNIDSTIYQKEVV